MVNYVSTTLITPQNFVGREAISVSSNTRLRRAEILIESPSGGFSEFIPIY